MALTRWFNKDSHLYQTGYPYFAVSFFNLIPSCHDCNAREKGSKEFMLETHVHPYVDSFDDLYNFSLNSALLTKGIFAVDLNPRAGLTRSDKTNSDLNLSARYNANLQSVRLIYDWYQKYSSRFEQDLQMHVDFFKSHFPESKCNILKTPRAKLLRDIFQHIDAKKIFPLI